MVGFEGKKLSYGICRYRFRWVLVVFRHLLEGSIRRSKSQGQPRTKIRIFSSQGYFEELPQKCPRHLRRQDDIRMSTQGKLRIDGRVLLMLDGFPDP